MESIDLNSAAKNIYSQNGEDGIIEKIFEVIGTSSKACCEFGAWDGFHLANTRNLLDKGWKALLIEADPVKFKVLEKNYSDNCNVVCACELVDDGKNSLKSIIQRYSYEEQLDFLSVDIDGLDYYILEKLDILPRVICIEVNAGHSPHSNTLLHRDQASENVGQPLACFTDIASSLGYRLVCYTGNAFFIRKDIGYEQELPSISPVDAYQQFLGSLKPQEKEWLYLVNKGLVAPYYNYNNEFLTEKVLSLKPYQIPLLLAKQYFPRLIKR